MFKTQLERDSSYLKINLLGPILTLTTGCNTGESGDINGTKQLENGRLSRYSWLETPPEVKLLKFDLSILLFDHYSA